MKNDLKTMNKYNIVILGSEAVGKTSLIKRAFSMEFDNNYEPTLQEEYDYEISVDGTTKSIHIYDTAGQEEFKEMRNNTITEGDGFIVVFSLADGDSFKELNNLKNIICRIFGTEETNKTIPLVVVGNKNDLSSDRQVTTEEINILTNDWKLKYFEVSAKNNTDLKEIVVELVKMIKDNEPIRALSDNEKKSKFKNKSPRQKNKERIESCIIV